MDLSGCQTAPSSRFDSGELPLEHDFMTVVEEENDFTEAVDAVNALKEKRMTEKERVVKEIETLKQDVIKFRADFEEHGPMAPDIEAAETLRRLKHFKE